jgi:hypothetical protein
LHINSFYVNVRDFYENEEKKAVDLISKILLEPEVGRQKSEVERKQDQD